jgi:hypothetical protein
VAHVSTRARICRYLALLCTAVAPALPPSAANAQELGSAIAQRVERALQSDARMAPTRTKDVTQPGWTWSQFQVHDETYPLTVDVVGSSVTPATKVMYMLPGGSTNFVSAYFTPNHRNIVQFLCEKGYVVIGVSPREDNIPSNATNYQFTESWGLAKHTADVRSIVAQLQPALALPYEVLGHSYGAITALDYAARYVDTLVPERVIALDIYSLDVRANPVAQQDASRTYQAHVQLMARGEYVDRTYALLIPAKALTQATPSLDSGISRASYGHSGTFTIEGLFFATLTDGLQQDGIHTALTGLPGDWLLIKGMFAGRYAFADNPRDDRYAFTRTRFATLLSTVDEVGSGLVPVALERDVWAVNAGDPAYSLDWAAIRQPVIWINTELGYGPHRFGAQLIREGGNSQVTDSQLLGYGHGDILSAETARFDAWQQLVL